MFINCFLFIYLSIYFTFFFKPSKEVSEHKKLNVQNYLNRVRNSKNCEFLQSFHHSTAFSPYKIKYDVLCRICVKVCIYSIVLQSKIFDFCESVYIMKNVLLNAQFWVSFFVRISFVKRKLESDTYFVCTLFVYS